MRLMKVPLFEFLMFLFYWMYFCGLCPDFGCTCVCFWLSYVLPMFWYSFGSTDMELCLIVYWLSLSNLAQKGGVIMQVILKDFMFA
jgi:hypothetical protein